MTAIILSVTFLFVGCGTDIIRQEQTIPSVESGKSTNDNLTNTDNLAENYETLNTDNLAENHETLNTDNITENSETTNEKTDMYYPVIEEYRDMVQNDFYEDLLLSDAYDSSFGEHIGFEIRARKKAVFYALYDIDGNGIKELIIAGGEDGVGVANPAFSPWNYDLYGYDGKNVVHIFPGIDLGGRVNFSLYENGVIEVLHSASGAELKVDFYKIGNDGFTPELIDWFYVVSHLEGDKSVFNYYQNGNEITEEEYNANIQNYEVALTAGLDWIEIY